MVVVSGSTSWSAPTGLSWSAGRDMMIAILLLRLTGVIRQGDPTVHFLWPWLFAVGIHPVGACFATGASHASHGAPAEDAVGGETLPVCRPGVSGTKGEIVAKKNDAVVFPLGRW